MSTLAHPEPSGLDTSNGPREDLILSLAEASDGGLDVSDSNDGASIRHKLGSEPDTDSGHGQTSSSSAASNSSDNDDPQQTDCFVDASEDLISHHHHHNHNHHALELEEPRVDGFKLGHPSSRVIIKNRHSESIKRPHEHDPPATDQPDRAQLSVQLEETRQILRMALSNEFVKALEICDKTADRELYTGLANATLCFIRTALTMEASDLQAALCAIQQSFEVSSRLRRKTSMMIRLLYRPNYNLYTDDEIHAELVHAESLLMLALISFLADQSIICLVKGAFRIRTCYQRYKECLYILESRNKWATEEARRHFESGVRMGLGVFNLLMSYLPRRVLKFLEYVGFSGNRSIGIDELEHSVALDDGLRSVFSALVILTYQNYVESFFGLGHYDAPKVRHLNETFLAHYPNSAIFLLFLGRYHQMEGQLDEAIESFQRCIRAQDDWKQFHSICHWEIMWSYACQMNWSEAAHYSNLLRTGCKWSQASYTYLYGTILYAKLIEDQRKGLCEPDSADHGRRMEEICQIMAQVPKLRVRYAGKTLPAEKFAITRSVRFLEQANRLTAPALEYMYVWNVFSTLTKADKHVEGLLANVNHEIEQLNKRRQELTTSSGHSDQEEQLQSEPSDRDADDGEAEHQPIRELDTYHDDLALLFLLKGLCLKLLNRLDEAEQSFMDVINSESRIKLDTFLVPHAAMELALLNITNRRRYESGREWIKLARQNYTGYLQETIVHFRLHSAMRVIRMEQQEQELTGSSCDSPVVNGLAAGPQNN